MTDPRDRDPNSLHTQDDGHSHADDRSQQHAAGLRLPGWLTETPYWAVSAVIHLLLVLLIGGLVMISEPEDRAEEVTLVKTYLPPEPFDKSVPRDIFEAPEILAQVLKQKPIVSETVQVEVPKGDPENKSATDLDDTKAILDTIGTGPGAAGGRPFGSRNDWGEPGCAGSIRAESAIRAALEWLRRHQHPDGHWSSDEYFRTHSDAPYKLVKYPGYSDGTGFKGFDIGVTSLAIMAFLGFGETHRHGRFPEYRPVVQKAVDWLLKQQHLRGAAEEDRGRFGATDPEEWIYNHALATMALSELLLMTGDRIRLSRSVEHAADYCLRAQTEGYGWRYKYQGSRSDTSVTGWMVLALKTARQCARVRMIRLDKSRFKPAFQGALAWFETSKGSSGRTGYLSPGDPGSSLQRVYDDPYPFTKDLSCMTAVAVLCRIFSGESPRSSDIKKGIAVLREELPDWRPARNKRKSKINMYYWYYATYAMFQHGGAPWREWNEAMLAALIPTQIHGGADKYEQDEDGSWDPVGEWGIAGGRVYATAINAMTLEVYHRFARAEDRPDLFGLAK